MFCIISCDMTEAPQNNWDLVRTSKSGMWWSLQSDKVRPGHSVEENGPGIGSMSLSIFQSYFNHKTIKKCLHVNVKVVKCKDIIKLLKVCADRR